MRKRWSVAVVVTILLAACTGGSVLGPSPNASQAPQAPTELLMLQTANGVAAVDATTGTLLARIDGAVPSADWSHVYTSSPEPEGGTQIHAIDATTGNTVATRHVDGDVVIRAVSADGTWLALSAPPPAGASTWAPAPAAISDISIAASDGSSPPERFHLHGNFEPEALSADGAWLYMLQYRPPMDPASYRVTRLDIEKGRVTPVYGPNKGPVENMTATRLHQVASPDEGALYTLYTNQPPAYLHARPVTRTSEADEVAFVHTLSLRDGFAFCTELPKPFGSASASGSAIAVSPGGSRVFAIDADHGRITVIRPDRQRIVHDAPVDLSAIGHGPVSARVTDDGSTLLVAGAAGVVPVDAVTLEPRRLVPTPGAVTGLALSPDGARLFVSWDGGIGLLDPASLQTVDTLPSPLPGAVAYVT
jgi:hypothetical protein